MSDDIFDQHVIEAVSSVAYIWLHGLGKYTDNASIKSINIVMIFHNSMTTTACFRKLNNQSGITVVAKAECENARIIAVLLSLFYDGLRIVDLSIGQEEDTLL